VRTYSELELSELAKELADEIRLRGKKGRPRLILEGVMGAGKSTLARLILTHLGVRKETEGSPTFAIAHEYEASDGFRVVHADGYRLKGDSDLEQTGLLDALWDPEVSVLFEWMELFPDTSRAMASGDLPAIWIRLGFTDDSNRREIEMLRTGY
jgi:tRNA threonylcarbamoyl adenosine modification protein YjeE